MNFRMAVIQDLQQIQEVYKNIVKNMEENNIQIWDESYPCDFFREDIEHNRLYVLFDNDKLVSAFALCDTNAGEKSIEWKECCGKALYLDRLGVNVNDLKKGIGSKMITMAKETAKALGAAYLRLFVVDINEPAIKLYIKNGFTRASGIYDEVFEDGFVFHEYGYETEL